MNPSSRSTFSCITLCLLVLFASMVSAIQARAGESKPNVVFILADDLGWSDTTLFGTTKFYQTPHIQRLAKRGMTFSKAYSSSPLCSPTRASILTGLSPARHGITSPNCHLPKVVLKATESASAPPNRFSTVPNSVSRLDTRYDTLAEMFKANGYATGHFGKWHLGAKPYSPLQHGFDVDIPHHPGPGPAGSYVAPWKFKDFDHDPDVPNQHLEDRMAKEAVAFIEQHQDRPFFLNHWMFSVHAPFDAKAALIDKYSKKVDPKDPQRSPTYAAMIESMDDAVGTLLDTLDRLKLADNTIIIFASDNGGNMYNEVDGTTATSNAPLRGGKATMYEGGVRGPAIVVQPGVVKAGSRSDEVIQSSDFYPTLLEMLSLPAQPEQTFDGISIVPALRGESLNREAIFTYFPHAPGVPDWLPPSVSVHSGDWKLIRIFHGGKEGQHRYKLFNLKEDISEKNDLAAEFPARVRKLDALIEQHLEATNAVRPLRNPKFDLAKYRPELEGQGKLKPSRRIPRKQPQPSAKPSTTSTGQRKPNIIVIYTDDHGYADLSSQKVFDDVKTPHIDALATSGVRMTDGYCTAPQCVPSRGGLLSGQYQTKWGLESNPQFKDPQVMKRFNELTTLPERLKKAGYATGMTGKWHLGSNEADAIATHGFDKVFHKNSNGPGHWNMNLQGEDVEPQIQKGGDYHLEMTSQFACTFIDRYKDQPFFFYLAYRAPHVPLDATPKYLKRFPGKMPERRRQALAMLSAVDDGVGQIMATLRKHSLEEDTLIFFISDNGAPLKIHKLDAPGGGPGWDGSLNDPLNGEKGMLTEGGIRVPFVVSWKGTIPAGQTYSHPVITLDVAATANALAGLPEDPVLDGVNLMPYLTGEKKGAPHEVLYWRWLGQSAIRKGKWKYLRSDDREYLFDMETDFEETNDVLKDNPKIATSLHADLKAWAATQSPPGLWAMKSAGMSRAAARYFDWYIDGKREEGSPPTRSLQPNR